MRLPRRTRFSANEDVEVDTRESSALEGGRSLILDAIAITLEQRQVGQPWYTSTINLQLASLGVCTLCRNMAMLHVQIERRTPPTLWVDATHSWAPKSPLKHAIGKLAMFASRKGASGRKKQAGIASHATKCHMEVARVVIIPCKSLAAGAGMFHSGRRVQLRRCGGTGRVPEGTQKTCLRFTIQSTPRKHHLAM